MRCLGCPECSDRYLADGATCPAGDRAAAFDALDRHRAEERRQALEQARDAARWRALAPALVAWVEAQRAYDGALGTTYGRHQDARDAARRQAYVAVKWALGGES